MPAVNTLRTSCLRRGSYHNLCEWEDPAGWGRETLKETLFQHSSVTLLLPGKSPPFCMTDEKKKKKIEYDHLARLVCHLLPLLLPCHARSLSLSLSLSLSHSPSFSLFLSCTINTKKKKHRSCKGWRDSACPKGLLYLNACQCADCLNLSV